ncbi:MAG: twin-arginine translocase TatA/TatE family subunit [Bacteriovoracaceae bacterium]|nr:twin-arginine translocase TatA/TatE family subunit [Bacteriovoracaceae bacterium]
MFGLGVGEIMLICVVALLFIGPKKIPDLAKGMGKGIRDFQKALKGEEVEESKKDQTKIEFTDKQS